MNILFAASDAYWIGSGIGIVVYLGSLGAGIFKCISISRRPTTNSKCAWSLALLLMAWLLPGIVIFALGGPGPEGSGMYLTTMGLAALASLGLMIGSVILAIIGLVEISQGRGRFVQGQAQAVWALSLCAVWFVVGVTLAG